MHQHIIDSELTLKATPPRSPKSFLIRESLALASARFRDSGVVSVAAPAGYGKTSLLTQWRREVLARGAICAWLTLDERDTPDRLVRGLRMALVLACGTAPSAVAIEQLLTPGQSAIEAATAWLANVAALATEVVVLIDDIHAMADTPARQLLAYVAVNAPANLILVGASRSSLSPATLSLLPQGANLAVVTAADLRLSARETERLLRQQFDSELELGVAERLHERSGGWPLGLQLIASTVRGNPRLQNVIDTVSAESGDVTRYFRQCLDERLSTEQMQFLMQIAVVDLITPDLCNVLITRTDARATLEELQANTPLFAETLSGDWLRIHALALDFLRERGRKSFSHIELDRLHVAASRWFEAHDMPEPAARHAFAGGNAEIAFALAERSLPDLLVTGDITRIQEWLFRIPREEMLRRPRIAETAIWTQAIYAERHGQADALIESVLDSPHTTPATKAVAAATMIFLYQANDALEQASERLKKWSDQLDPQEPKFELMHRIANMFGQVEEGQSSMSRDMCEQEMKAPSTSHNFAIGVLLSSLLGYSHYWDGHLALAESVERPRAEAARSRFGRRSTASTIYDVLLARTLWERGETGEATSLMADRIDILERLRGFRLVSYGHTLLARMAIEERNESRALQLLENLHVIGQVRGIARLRCDALIEQIKIHAHAGRGRTCETLLERLERIAESPEARRNTHSIGLLELRVASARAQACLAKKDHPGAMSHATQALERAKSLRNGIETVAMQLLLALCKRRLGEPHEALLIEAMSLADVYGLKRIARDTHPDIEALIEALRKTAPTLDAFAPVPRPAATSAIGSVRGTGIQIMPSALLTPKEREVLKHLAEGCANKRIASILDVSDETVKWHVKNLSAKLGGANRKHVVDRARQMGIIT